MLLLGEPYSILLINKRLIRVLKKESFHKILQNKSGANLRLHRFTKKLLMLFYARVLPFFYGFHDALSRVPRYESCIHLHAVRSHHAYWQ